MGRHGPTLLGVVGLALVALAGLTATVGAGALACVAGGLLLARGAGSAAVRLLAVWAALVLLGGMMLQEGLWGLPGAVGLLALWGAARGQQSAPGGPWRLPAGPAVAAGVLALAYAVVPAWLPQQIVVHARPWEDTWQVGVALLGLALGSAALGRVGLPPHGGAALLLAGALTVGRAALVLAQPAPADGVSAVDTVTRARALGMRGFSRAVLAAWMERELGAGHAPQVWALWQAASGDDESVRRDVRVLLAAAQALEVLGGSAQDVDVLVQRAFRFWRGEDVAALAAWPGNARARDAAWRARSSLAGTLGAPAAPPHDGMECYGGTWCLLSAQMGQAANGDAAAVMHTRWRQVAPAVGDALLELQVGWSGWRSTAVIPAGVHAPGDTFDVTLEVDVRTLPGGAQELWLRLFPLDGGEALLLERKPGPSYRLGMWEPAQ